VCRARVALLRGAVAGCCCDGRMPGGQLGEDLARGGGGDVALKLHARQAEHLLQDLLVVVLIARRFLARGGLEGGIVGRWSQPCALLQALHLRHRERRIMRTECEFGELTRSVM
jgi:hypothetical protein